MLKQKLIPLILASLFVSVQAHAEEEAVQHSRMTASIMSGEEVSTDGAISSYITRIQPTESAASPGTAPSRRNPVGASQAGSAWKGARTDHPVGTTTRSNGAGASTSAGAGRATAAGGGGTGTRARSASNPLNGLTIASPVVTTRTSGRIAAGQELDRVASRSGTVTGGVHGSGDTHTSQEMGVAATIIGNLLASSSYTDPVTHKSYTMSDNKLSETEVTGEEKVRVLTGLKNSLILEARAAGKTELAKQIQGYSIKKMEDVYYKPSILTLDAGYASINYNMNNSQLNSISEKLGPNATRDEIQAEATRVAVASGSTANTGSANATSSLATILDLTNYATELKTSYGLPTSYQMPTTEPTRYKTTANGGRIQNPEYAYYSAVHAAVETHAKANNITEPSEMEKLLASIGKATSGTAASGTAASGTAASGTAASTSLSDAVARINSTSGLTLNEATNWLSSLGYSSSVVREATQKTGLTNPGTGSGTVGLTKTLSDGSACIGACDQVTAPAPKATPVSQTGGIWQMSDGTTCIGSCGQ